MEQDLQRERTRIRETLGGMLHVGTNKSRKKAYFAKIQDEFDLDNEHSLGVLKEFYSYFSSNFTRTFPFGPTEP